MPRVYVIDISDVEETKEEQINRAFENTKEYCKAVMATFTENNATPKEMFSALTTLILFLKQTGELDDAPTSIKDATNEFLDKLSKTGTTLRVNPDPTAN